MSADEATLEAPEAPEATPVPVCGEIRLTGRVDTSEEAADFGTYRTIVLTGTEDKQMILPYDTNRIRAYILCSGTGPVYVGSEAQCAAVRAGNTNGGGFRLPSGQSLPVAHKQPVWLVGDQANPAIVSIAQERMRS